MFQRNVIAALKCNELCTRDFRRQLSSNFEWNLTVAACMHHQCWDFDLRQELNQTGQIPKGFLLLAVFGGVSLRARQHFQVLAQECQCGAYLFRPRRLLAFVRPLRALMKSEAVDCVSGWFPNARGSLP